MFYRYKLIYTYIAGVDFRASGDGVVQTLDSLSAVSVVADDVPLP